MTDWLTDCLMPSDKCNLITTKATGLIFSLFDIASTGAFWHTAVCTMHSSWTYQYPLCVPFIFADNKSVDLAIARDGFPL